MRIIEFNSNNKIINVRHGSCLSTTKNELFSDTGLLGQIMVSERVFENDIYVDETDISNKIKELNDLCRVDIISNFESNAYQGILKPYDFDIYDQVNMIGQLLDMDRDSLSEVDYFATDEDCVKYTKEEYEKLWLDGKLHKFSKLARCKALKAQAKLCTLKTELESIVW